MANQSREGLSIVDGLMLDLMIFEEIKANEGPLGAEEFWHTEVRNPHIFGTPGMPDEVFARFVQQAAKRLSHYRKGINTYAQTQ